MSKDISEDIRNRFKEVLVDKSLNITRIGGRGTSLRSKLERQINGDAVITVDVIWSLVEAVPELSMEWLIKGNGEKYKEESVEDKWQMTPSILKRIEALEKQIRNLK